MKSLLFGLAVLLGQPGAAPPARPAAKATRQQATPESSFVALSNDVGALMRRAMREPSDEKALALLQGKEAAALAQRQHDCVRYL